MRSRFGLLVVWSVTLVSSGAAGCGLVYDYSDYTGTGGASSATTTTGDDGTTSGGSGGSGVTSSATGTGATSGATSSASGTGGSASCPGGCLADPGAGVKYVYRSPDGACNAGSSGTPYVECTSCTCGSAGTCPVTAVHLFSTTDCTGADTLYNSNQSCSSFMNQESFKADFGPGNSGTCAPTLPNVSASQFTLCAASAPESACSGGEVCAPTPNLFGNVCRLYPVDVTCPPEASVKKNIYAGSSGICDCSCTRTCGPARMTANSGGMMCQGGATHVIDFTGSCVAPPLPFDSYFPTNFDPPASCSPSPTLEGGAARTLCCPQ